MTHKPLTTALTTLFLTACAPTFAADTPEQYCDQVADLVKYAADDAAYARQSYRSKEYAYEEARIDFSETVPNYQGVEQRAELNAATRDVVVLAYEFYGPEDEALNYISRVVRRKVQQNCLDGFYGRGW